MQTNLTVRLCLLDSRVQMAFLFLPGEWSGTLDVEVFLDAGKSGSTMLPFTCNEYDLQAWVRDKVHHAAAVFAKVTL